MSASNEKGSFEIFISNYCKQRDITVSEALKHKIVREVKEQYESEK